MYSALNGFLKNYHAKVLIVVIALFASDAYAMRLSQFNYQSASVFPVYTYKNKKYGILAREAFGRDIGTYDDFGGSRDPGENHPVVTAAREWKEEGLVKKITGLNGAAIRNFIDVEKSDNTECVVAYERSAKVKTVVYITDVGKYKAKLLHKFYDARKKAIKAQNREKDRIAFVNLSTLKQVIIAQKWSKNQNNPVKVDAFVLDPQTNKFNKELVALRPFFVSKLRFYFLGKPYKKGMNEKIRFYSPGYQPLVKQSWAAWFKSLIGR